MNASSEFQELPNLSGHTSLHALTHQPLTSILEKTKTGHRLSLALLINRG